jgi:hypothetical protein
MTPDSCADVSLIADATPVSAAGGRSNRAIGAGSSALDVAAVHPMPRSAKTFHNVSTSPAPPAVAAACRIASRISRKLGSGGAIRSPPVMYLRARSTPSE